MFHPRVAAVARNKSGLFCQQCRWQVTDKHADTLAPTTSEWADYTVQARCGNLSGKRLHTQLVKERLATDVPAR